MVRKFKNEDLDKVLEIWLNVNINAHSFIDKNYYINNFNYVKEALLSANIFVYEENNEILGFIGLNDSYVEGIFVKENSQNKGIGAILINYIKNLYDNLTLKVYKKNIKAINFYKKQNFIVLKENLDEDTSEIEYIMEHKRL